MMKASELMIHLLNTVSPGMAPRDRDVLAVYGLDGSLVWGTGPASILNVSNAAQVEATNTEASDFPDSGFRFGAKSERELKGVHPILVDVMRLALRYTTQDFMIFDGVRTKEEQAGHVRNGTSKTMDSKHLPQVDGWSHAVDAVPYDKVPVWDWDMIYHVTLAVDKAATELGVADKIVWGGAWDRKLSDFGGDAEAYKRVVEEYVARKKATGSKSVFIDGPHFELRL